ncbi:NADH-quinone oxidoreductase subunit N [Marinigracilibium pacificum]|uniref:NADH-quinone oxidoreductase subunit N n=1 Tax=Marinigracilibium pacificum TaxID=2729599 RepID=A0A848J3A7_9BACT|nr:NADH-quinone oxidoreductase subunit N [Marinigracilibium pacificum]NMM48974.1 NADH-quinone oxidoreductase subunit N [Marinigracilibium pacificum]
MNIVLLNDIALYIDEIIRSLPWLTTEYTLVLSIIAIIVMDLLFGKQNPQLLYMAATAGLLVALIMSISDWNVLEQPADIFNGMIRVNRLSLFLSILLILATLLTILITSFEKPFKDHNKGEGEYFVLLSMITLGSILMVKANHFLMFFLAIETVSMGSYLIAGFRFDKQGSEGAMKYVLFGAFASAIMLYGISLLYGYTDSFEFVNLKETAATNGKIDFGLGFALIMIISGLFFKISIFPFHVWVPDVYKAAPTSITAFFSIVPKIAGLMLMFNIVNRMGINNLEITAISLTLDEMLGIAAIFTLIISNFSAIWQTSGKRMMAYSSISHAGFMMIAILSLTEMGLYALLFYLFVYMLMNYGVFFILIKLEIATGSDEISDFKGMGKAAPIAATALVILMLSLTGLPPTAGFTAKFILFTTVWENFELTGKYIYLFLLLIGLATSVVALFYYLRIPYFMYFKEHQGRREPVTLNLFELIFLLFLTIPIFLLFFQPDWLFDVINSINFASN